MSKNLIGLAATWILAVSAMGQVTSPRLPDPKLFEVFKKEGFKIENTREKPNEGSISFRRLSDNARFRISYGVKVSAEEARDYLHRGPPGDQGIPHEGTYTGRKIGEKSWISTWPDGKPTGGAKLTVLLDDYKG